MPDSKVAAWRERCAEALEAALLEMGLKLENSQKEKLLDYGEMILEGNQRMNLTALEEPEDVACKHLADSLLPLCYGWTPENASVVDVGTGAGLPGIPLSIVRPDIELLLLDSLEKRLGFVRSCCEALGIEASIRHIRAEDAGWDKLYRDHFDVAVSRAVAPAAVLAEYCMPLVKPGGYCLAYKGSRGREEFAGTEKTLALLSAKVIAIEERNFSWGERSLVRIGKVAPTSNKYPRKAVSIKKNPL